MNAQFERAARHALVLVSAPAGFGKSTAVAQWLSGSGRRGVWVPVDRDLRDTNTLITVFIRSVQAWQPSFGAELLRWTLSPERPPASALTAELVRELATLGGGWVLVLDDAHHLGAEGPSFLRGLLDGLSEVPLVLLTREDPDLPLARLRASGQLAEFRADDLRFTAAETEAYLNRQRQLGVTPEQRELLQTKTEGWAAGLQLAALSLERTADRSSFLRSFSGTNRFVADYLLEEVWRGLNPDLQDFLLGTAPFERLCGGLCDAVLGLPPGTGQERLNALESANLFLLPLDEERRWFRYHHLFADLLRQRVGPSEPLHLRAIPWFEEQGLEADAFDAAVRSGDVPRAARLLEGGGMPLIFRGAVVPALAWLQSLPPEELDRRPSLWVLYASALLFVSQIAGIETKLARAEQALGAVAVGDPASDLVGHVASIRATVAVLHRDAARVTLQSQRAQAFLDPANRVVRAAVSWTSAVGHHLQGDRVAARRDYTEALESSQALGHSIIVLMASLGLGKLAEEEGKTDEAQRQYRFVIDHSGKMTVACEAWLGLGRMALARRLIAEARDAAQRSIDLARRVPGTDPLVFALLLLARIENHEGRASLAEPLLTEALQLMEAYGLEQCRDEYNRTAGVERSGLSAREQEVLVLIAQGLSNEAIAQKLFLAESSVKGHNQRIFEKLGVARRTEAVAKARELGLLGP